MNFQNEFNQNTNKMLLSDINITPFVDVVLVLLIIFMVTAPLAISGVSVQLPNAKAKPMTLSEDPLILSIDNKGRFYLNKLMIAPEQLVEKIKSIRGSKKDLSIYIRADKDTSYEKVMEAMSASQAAGIAKIGMLGEGVVGTK